MDWYYSQLEETVPLTQEKLSQLKMKHYDSGRPYQIGDIILYGFKQITPNDVKLITFHLDEVNTLYKIKDSPFSYLSSSSIPVLIPIT